MSSSPLYKCVGLFDLFYFHYEFLFPFLNHLIGGIFALKTRNRKIVSCYGLWVMGDESDDPLLNKEK